MGNGWNVGLGLGQLGHPLLLGVAILRNAYRQEL